LKERPDVPIRPASTVLLVRDRAEQLEVFMVQRHHQIDFASGALVFPGGRVEPADSEPAVRERTAGAEAWDDDTLGFRVAAVRETFEECGVLLARARGESSPLPAERVRALRNRYAAPLQADELTMPAFLAAEDLEIRCDRLIPFAHWITPPVMPKRFDTHFFLVTAPDDQLALHDGEESVDSVWTTVEQALEAERAGTRTIIFPTLANLQKLGRAGSVAEAIDRARSEPLVTVLPKVGRRDDGEAFLKLPEDAGYELNGIPLKDMPGKP
jgi:8-oxo-dGTP pyrophosphatase MutT (NUDIX family)